MAFDFKIKYYFCHHFPFGMKHSYLAHSKAPTFLFGGDRAIGCFPKLSVILQSNPPLEQYTTGKFTLIIKFLAVSFKML